MAEVVVRTLAANGRTLAVAESCTGGGLGQRITEVPGASACFLGGVVAYDNRIKEELLGVGAELLQRFGAVSEPVAKALAEGARRRLGASIGVSTTGVAGPGGGTPAKPVGLVHIGVSTEASTQVLELRLSGDREAIRERTVDEALAAVWRVARGA
ncbi:MAG: nicotinamide-nucleotide amidohydrolase family protein [Myxococcales bacterium]|nr:nicotinamide-nucleotide amidohydrolase family protein [Myxococcales bacterium]